MSRQKFQELFKRTVNSSIMKKCLLCVIFLVALFDLSHSQNRTAHQYRYTGSCHFSEGDNRSIPFTDSRLVGKSVYYVFDTQNQRCYETQTNGTYDPEGYSLSYEGEGVYSFSTASGTDLLLGVMADDVETILGDFGYVYDNFTVLQFLGVDEDGYDCSHFYSRTGNQQNARPQESY